MCAFSLRLSLLTAASLAVFSFLTLAPTALAQTASATPVNARIATFDAYVAKAVVDWQVPGLAVAVVKDGELLLAKGYGVRELGKPASIDTHTLFAIGSTTKAMTAAAIGLLVDEGKVKWDDPVIDHLPSFRLSDPYVTREVTVRDLLTHRAGLPNADYLWFGADNASADIIRRLRFVPPESSLRSHFTYQNIMYAAAGELIAAVSGQPWARFVQTRLWTPIGMTATVPTMSAIGSEKNVASPHFRVDGTVRVISNVSVDPVAAAGAVWSNVDDMSRWLRFLLNDCTTAGAAGTPGVALLKATTCAELFKPQTMVGADGFYPTARLTRPKWTTYGLGWFQQDYAGRALDYHTGSIDGMATIAGLMRDDNLGIIIVENLDHAELRHALMFRIFDTFNTAGAIGTADGASTMSAGTNGSAGSARSTPSAMTKAAVPALRDWSSELRTFYGELAKEARAAQVKDDAARVANTKPSLAIERYAGRYTHPLYGTVAVSADAGTLRLRYGSGYDGALEHWHYDTFKARWSAFWFDPSLVTFTLDPSGAPATLELNGLRFTRAK